MTVAVGVLVTLGDGLAPNGTAFKVLVLDVDTSVNNVSGHTGTGVRVISVGLVLLGGWVLAVRDTGDTPGRDVALDIKGVEDLVLLYVSDLVV